MHHDEEARGFAGLVFLASTISDVDEKAGTTGQLPSSKQESARSDTSSSSTTTRTTLDSPRPIGKSSGGKDFWLNRIRIIAVFAFLMIVAWATIDAVRDRRESPGTETPPAPGNANPVQNPPRSSNQPRPSVTQSRPRPPIGVDLASQIESEKAQVVKMEGQIGEMDDRLDKLRRSMKSYEDLEMIDEYNELVPIYNSVLDQRIELYSKYDRLINEINAKVKRYNSGER